MPLKPNLSISVPSSLLDGEASPIAQREAGLGSAVKKIAAPTLRERMAHLSVGLESSSSSPKSQHGSNPSSFLTPNRRTFDYFDATPKVIAKGGFGSVRIATPRPGALMGNNQTSPLANHQELILKEGKFQPSVGAAQVRREVSAMEKLAGVNSPKLLNQEITSSGYRLVMKQAPGAQFNHFFDNVIRNVADEEQAALLKATSKELLLGLQNLHNKDVCHRDIKPGNVFVSKNDDNKIQVTYIDFGDASPLHEADQGASGTDKYSLPSKEDKTAAEIDLYSMGRMLAEATGQIPELRVDFERQELEYLSPAGQAEVAKPVGEQAATQEAFINTLCYKQGLTLSDAINHPWLQS